jgi:hypothetical protein
VVVNLIREKHVGVLGQGCKKILAVALPATMKANHGVKGCLERSVQDITG